MPESPGKPRAPHALTLVLPALLFAALAQQCLRGWPGMLQPQPPQQQQQQQPAAAGAAQHQQGAQRSAYQMEAEEAMLVGQVFAAQKVSEIMMSEEVQEALGLESEEIERERSLSGPAALDLLSVHISDDERATLTLRPETTADIARRVREHGVVVLPRLIAPETCRAVAHDVQRAILSPEVEFGGIMQRKFRKDLPLPLTQNNSAFVLLRDALRAMGPALRETLGDDPELKEFSTLTSFPGAKEQRFHADSSVAEPEQLKTTAKLYSAFIYLDDVGADVAPLDVRPGTHTHFHFLDDTQQLLLSLTPYVRLAVPQGSVALYDSRLLHRGGPNTSELTRPTLYFSLLEPGKSLPDGPTYSLRDVKKPITLSDIEQSRVPSHVRRTAQLAAQDDAMCLKSIRAAGCDAEGDALHACAVDVVKKASDRAKQAAREARGEVASDGEGSTENSSDDDDDDDNDINDGLGLFGQHWRSLSATLPGCTLMSRVEKVCQGGIFAKDAHVTWGVL